jgi:hypothetical protein
MTPRYLEDGFFERAARAISFSRATDVIASSRTNRRIIKALKLGTCAGRIA